jgi:hypothetical protein
VLPQILLRQVDDLGGDSFALKILRRFDRRVLGYGQDPARRLACDFAEEELADFMDAGSVLLHPVVPGDTAIQVAKLDIAADFLGADHPDLQFRVVHVRNIGTAVDGNIPARLGHLLDGGFLQAAFG